MDDFKKCVNEITHKDGSISVTCKLGLWGVEDQDSDSVYREAYHYWSQYYDAGEYSSILGGESVGEKLKTFIMARGHYEH